MEVGPTEIEVEGRLRLQPPFDIPEPEPGDAPYASMRPGHHDGWWELREIEWRMLDDH